MFEAHIIMIIYNTIIISMSSPGRQRTARNFWTCWSECERLCWATGEYT